MGYMVTADTDIGISKKTNQDSVCIRIADTASGQIVMAVMCDGMGGLSKGEVASASVVMEFEKWFEEKLPYCYQRISWEKLANEWEGMLKRLNAKIMKYGKKFEENIGTTVTAILIMNDKYMSVNVGDSRLYRIRPGRNIRQLTQDQTLVQQEVNKGLLTLEEARKDPRKNILLQCIGASKNIYPEIRFGRIEGKSTYMLCSDGLRNELGEDEMAQQLIPGMLHSKEDMHNGAVALIEKAKERQEKDNISVILIRTEE